jgi:hypothetical protein
VPIGLLCATRAFQDTVGVIALGLQTLTVRVLGLALALLWFGQTMGDLLLSRFMGSLWSILAGRRGRRAQRAADLHTRGAPPWGSGGLHYLGVR